MCTEVRILESPYFKVERLADGVYAAIFSTSKTSEKLVAVRQNFSDIERVQAAYQQSVDAMEIACQAYPADSIFAIDVRTENQDKRKLIEALPHVQLTLPTLERVKESDIETTVLGHGAVVSRAYIDHTANYVAELIERVEAAVERGETLEEVMSLPIPAQYATWRAPHVFKWNLKALYNMVTRERVGFAVKVL